jgi:Tripartite tricarboxylate transporter family receptor
MGATGIRDSIVAAALMLALIPANSVPAYADEFPSRPIRLIVPFAPGGPSDIAARMVADAMRNVVGQPMIIENKPGAGAIVATQSLLHAPADGYSLMMASNNLVIGKLLYKHLPFDSLRDLRAIIGVTRSPHFVLVTPTFPRQRSDPCCQAAGWKAELRLRRCRHRASFGGRTAQAAARPRHDPCPLSGLGTGADRSDVGPSAGLYRPRAVSPVARKGWNCEGARRHDKDPPRGISGYPNA